uniref:Uncharacterized protein n=1 Tax=Strombidium rassoulzadegani TaxID=1082188 RepID=A0A7S3CJY0_9SPIT|mmetsp:Transcript_13825/g.23580  ORF Transcript_13825/g.23580 Transcript_13825/m.23580 type:complete len:328 (+) Transcript_13825:493-1476(+)
MELGGHVVALVPVGLPLAEDGEAGVKLEVDEALVSGGVRSADVADVVVVVEALDVLGELDAEVADGVLALIGVEVGHVVDPRELAIDAGRLVEQVEVLVDRDGAPVGHENASLGLREEGQGVGEGEEELNLGEGNGLDVLVATECHVVSLNAVRLLAVEMDVGRLDLESELALLGGVDAHEVLGLVELHCLLLVNLYGLGVWLPPTFVVLVDCELVHVLTQVGGQLDPEKDEVVGLLLQLLVLEEALGQALNPLIIEVVEGLAPLHVNSGVESHEGPLKVLGNGVVVEGFVVGVLEFDVASEDVEVAASLHEVDRLEHTFINYLLCI